MNPAFAYTRMMDVFKFGADVERDTQLAVSRIAEHFMAVVARNLNISGTS